MTFDQKTFEILSSAFLVAIISLLGGMARLFMVKSEEKMTGSDFIKQLFISGFAGLMIFFLIPEQGMLTNFLAGMSGFTAPYTLYFLSNKFKSMLEGVSNGNK